jgi:hypothetical protein
MFFVGANLVFAPMLPGEHKVRPYISIKVSKHSFD